MNVNLPWLKYFLMKTPSHVFVDVLLPLNIIELVHCSNFRVDFQIKRSSGMKDTAPLPVDVLVPSSRKALFDMLQ